MKFRTLCSAVALAAGFAASNAWAGTLPTFTVDEGELNTLFPGSGLTNQDVTADDIQFTYNTVITITGANTFTETGTISFTNFKTGGAGGTGVSSQLSGNGTLSSTQYGLLGNLVASGTFTETPITSGSGAGGTAFNATFSSIGVQLYLVKPGTDWLADRNAGCEAGTDETCTAGADSGDYVAIGTSNRNPQDTSTATINSAGDPGDWDIYTTVDWNSAGEAYAFAPPSAADGTWELTMFSSGNNSAPTFVGSTIDDNGSGDATFAIPEPASLLMLGAGLFGAGVFGRRRKRTTA